MFRRSHFRIMLLATTLAWVPAVQAQAPAAAPADPAFDEIILLPSLGVSRTAIERATADARMADEVGAYVRGERSRTRSRIEIAKAELQTVKKRLELAKKEKLEAEQVELQRERETLEGRVRLLERWLDVHEAAVRASEAQQAAAEARRKLAEAEIALVEKKQQAQARVTTDSAALAPVDDDLRRAARRLLELRREDAGRRREHADRERQLAQQQLDLLEARYKTAR